MEIKAKETLPTHQNSRENKAGCTGSLFKANLGVLLESLLTNAMSRRRTRGGRDPEFKCVRALPVHNRVHSWRWGYTEIQSHPPRLPGGCEGKEGGEGTAIAFPPQAMRDFNKASQALILTSH